ncbi:MAG: hypothetical protein K8S97_05110 [Anaerolineae bacterium]|nr:hypothetical protein [Anaerolineae bacterium]
MITYADLLETLELINETLTATIVIVAVSILLYNLSRATQDRVTRTSALVLLCVTIAYTGDMFVLQEPGERYLNLWLRFQWIGIAYIPAAMLHLSDALLATTGRPSRGRRRLTVRVAYGVGSVFAGLVLFTKLVIDGPVALNFPHMRAGIVFPVYVLYMLVVGGFASINVVRARQRCLTRYTRRRMTYLLVVFPAPAWGIFPYSLLGGLGNERETTLLVILNLANLIVMLMLIFMAYPLSFFGSQKPDRVIKAQLLEFMLRGPLTGTGILAAILVVPRATNVMGLDGDAFLPFAAVAILLFLQWSITLVLPVLQRWLIYTVDQPRSQWIQRIGDRLLTQSDAAQLLESLLAALCDHLRVPTAFVATIESDGTQLVQVVGDLAPSSEALAAPELSTLMQCGANEDTAALAGIAQVDGMFIWRSYWLVPLRSTRPVKNGGPPLLLGVLGVWARAPEPDLHDEEQEVFERLTDQAARVLEGVRQQSEVFLILEGLASQMDVIQQLRGVSRYGHVSPLPIQAAPVISDSEFSERVRDALRDYWGGPKLTESELLRLNVVWREMETSEDQNSVRALRNVLAQAIENLKPEGERSLTTAEWMLYNILEMRFLQGRKVRDVALRLAMSESDLYRKQRIAIEEVAKQLEMMERDTVTDLSPGAPMPIPYAADEGRDAPPNPVA